MTFLAFSNVRKDKYLKVVAILSFFILAVAAVVFSTGIGSSDKPLILHFDAYQGIDFLGSQSQVFRIILTVFVILLVNFFLAGFLYRRDRFLSYIFAFVSLEISILILILISVIIAVNQ